MKKQQPTDFINLSDQQKRFCQEYMVSFNAYEAAKNAGYSDNTARKGELLHTPKIQDYLRAMMNKTAERLEITHDMILRELAKVAFSNLGDYYDYCGQPKRMCELSESEKAAISYYQILDAVDESTGHCYGTMHKIKLHNKMSALDKIARHLNFYGTGGKTEEERSVKQEQEIASRKAEEVLEDDVVLDADLTVVNNEGVLKMGENDTEDGIVPFSYQEEAFDVKNEIETIENILTLSPPRVVSNSEYQVSGLDAEYDRDVALRIGAESLHRSPLDRSTHIYQWARGLGTDSLTPHFSSGGTPKESIK